MDERSGPRRVVTRATPRRAGAGGGSGGGVRIGFGGDLAPGAGRRGGGGSAAGGPGFDDPDPLGIPVGPDVPGGTGFGTGFGTGPGEPLSDLLARRLLAQRVVLLNGPLDEVRATRVSAELMTLDADGDDPVTLRVDCGEAALAPALTLMDVIELMGVPVHALCLGQVGGGAVGIVAVCARRRALPSTRFALAEPSTQFEAHVRNVAQWAELRAAERRRFCQRLAAAVGRSADAVEADLDRGRFFSAEEAAAYGLLDEVAQPDAEIRHLPGREPGQPPMGFRPLR